MRYIFILVLLTTCQLSVANCIQSPNNVALTYQVIQTHQHVDENINHQPAKEQTAKRKLVLWRRPGQVVIRYPDTHISELWEKTSHGKLRLVKNFESHQRGIEYQPAEIKNGEGEKDWSLKYQLVSDQLVKSMQLVGEKTDLCGRIQQLYQANGKGSIQLDWLAKHSAFKSMQIDRNNIRTRWQLIKIDNNADKINRYFTQIQNFQTTDYTDIGDNESDPFLTDMINLGFIEHSHSPTGHQH